MPGMIRWPLLLLAALALLYYVYAYGEFALCYNRNRHNPNLLRESPEAIQEFCSDLHLKWPFGR